AYAAVDIFTCGDTIDPQDAASYLTQKLCAKNSSILLVERGTLNVVKEIIWTHPARNTCL
ncbi:MAG TPA: S-adenosylmethionine decarboxylase, partial [Candidatus Brocadiales bacterium]|nr:S-adenosylmethionine decarboxylase [Candidatus Brocadiales bacterium]